MAISSTKYISEQIGGNLGVRSIEMKGIAAAYTEENKEKSEYIPAPQQTDTIAQAAPPPPFPREISNAFKQAAANKDNTQEKTEEKAKADEDKQKTIEKATENETQELSQSEKQQIKELEKIDREVKAHEMAHKAAGGGLVRGGASYKYTSGPDGKRYVVGGEVKIDMSYDLDDPEKTIHKMQQVRRAALAPTDPSGTDRSVASQAASIEARARAEMSKQAAEENEDGGNNIAQNASNKLPEVYKNNYEEQGTNINKLENMNSDNNRNTSLNQEKQDTPYQFTLNNWSYVV